MSKVENAPLQVVFVVTCYQTIVGVYAYQEDACACQMDLISRNKPADVLCRNVNYGGNQSE